MSKEKSSTGSLRQRQQRSIYKIRMATTYRIQFLNPRCRAIVPKQARVPVSPKGM